MKASAFHPLFTLSVVGLLLSACAKDEVVVEPIPGPVSKHDCTRLRVQLNIDSLSHVAPWDSITTISVCSCDTVELRPANIPPDLEFERWSIDQGAGITSTTMFVLDTLTRDADLRVIFDHEPGHYHVQVPVRVRFNYCE
jgi:hypothetical protein